jgi:malonyl CoA-acyl carrier protein transacylase
MELEALERYESMLRRRGALAAELGRIQKDSASQASDVVEGSNSVFPFQRVRYIITGLDIRSMKSAEAGCRKLEKEIRELTKKIVVIEAFIETVEDPIIRTAMQLKYIKGDTWPKVSTEVYGSAAYADLLRKRCMRYCKRFPDL